MKSDIRQEFIKRFCEIFGSDFYLTECGQQMYDRCITTLENNHLLLMYVDDEGYPVTYCLME